MQPVVINPNLINKQPQSSQVNIENRKINTTAINQNCVRVNYKLLNNLNIKIDTTDINYLNQNMNILNNNNNNTNNNNNLIINSMVKTPQNRKLSKRKIDGTPTVTVNTEKSNNINVKLRRNRTELISKYNKVKDRYLMYYINWQQETETQKKIEQMNVIKQGNIIKKKNLNRFKSIYLDNKYLKYLSLI